MKRIALILSGALPLSLYGCGGGSGPGSGDSGGSALDRGRAQLERLASGAQNADAPSLESTLALFNQALQLTPEETKAHF